MNNAVLIGVAMSALAWGQQARCAPPLALDDDQFLMLDDATLTQLRGGDNPSNSLSLEKDAVIPDAAFSGVTNPSSALNLSTLPPSQTSGLNLSLGSEGVKAVVPW